MLAIACNLTLINVDKLSIQALQSHKDIKENYVVNKLSSRLVQQTFNENKE